MLAFVAPLATSLVLSGGARPLKMPAVVPRVTSAVGATEESTPQVGQMFGIDSSRAPRPRDRTTSLRPVCLRVLWTLPISCHGTNSPVPTLAADVIFKTSLGGPVTSREDCDWYLCTEPVRGNESCEHNSGLMSVGRSLCPRSATFAEAPVPVCFPSGVSQCGSGRSVAATTLPRRTATSMSCSFAASQSSEMDAPMRRGSNVHKRRNVPRKTCAERQKQTLKQRCVSDVCTCEHVQHDQILAQSALVGDKTRYRIAGVALSRSLSFSL